MLNSVETLVNQMKFKVKLPSWWIRDRYEPNKKGKYPDVFGFTKGEDTCCGEATISWLVEFPDDDYTCYIDKDELEIIEEIEDSDKEWWER